MWKSELFTIVIPEVRNEQAVTQDQALQPVPISPVSELTEAANLSIKDTRPVAGIDNSGAVPQPSASPIRTVQRPDFLSYNKLGG